MPQLFFLVQSSPTTFTFTTSLRVAKLRKPGFRDPNVAAQKGLPENRKSPQITANQPQITANQHNVGPNPAVECMLVCTLPTVTETIEEVDDKLFTHILNNPDHTLHQLLSKQTTHTYELRPRRHARELACKTNFDDNNFITRLMFKD